MNTTPNDKKSSDLVEKLIRLFKKLPTNRKKGDLSEMLKKDDFHNKNQTEEDYQKEQKEWLERVKSNKSCEK